MPYGTNLTALTPAITLSAGATVSPASGTTQNFTTPVTYTVTAADASTKTYSVTVTVAAAPPVAPLITGPASMTLTVGYAPASTDPFTITGTAPVKVAKTSGHDRITWNSATRRLDIAAGLPAGVYEVKLQAVNSAGTRTFTFTLTVGKPLYYLDIPVSFHGGTITIRSGNANLNLAQTGNVATRTGTPDDNTVTVRADNANPYLAEAGDVITLIATPDKGYKLNEIHVYLYGTTTAVPLNGSGTVYTFTMPAQHITVAATFGLSTAIEDVARGLQAFAQNGVLYISGLTAGQPWSIYSITGTLIYRAVPSAGKVEIPLPERGLYIVTDFTF
jgi:hypothetical protein